MTAKLPRRGARVVLLLSAVAAVVLAVPVGHYVPFHYVALKETTFARACIALPGRALERRIGYPVTASEVALKKPRVEVENLFPAVSRTACEYRLGKACVQPSTLKSVNLIVATLPNRSQALYRYTYNRELLHQDSYTRNHFRDFQIGHDRAYKLTIEDEVLERVLDGRYVIDMQFHRCRELGGSASQAAVQPLVAELQLPIVSTSKRPSAPQPDP